MSVPLTRSKYGEPSLFAPSDFLSYIRAGKQLPDDQPAPSGVILCYQKSLFDFVASHHAVSFHSGYFGGHLAYLEETGNRLAIAGRFGVGAPAAAVMLEELIAFGARSFMSIGTAGGLVKGLFPGDVVLCSGALRDEGLSYHYLPEGREALPDARLADAMASRLDSAGVAFRRGIAWTTDAIYRETRGEMAQRIGDGAIVVEMEAAALFAVAEYRKVSLAACFTVSDSLAETEWKPDFLSDDTNAGLEAMYRAAIGALGTSLA